MEEPHDETFFDCKLEAAPEFEELYEGQSVQLYDNGAKKSMFPCKRGTVTKELGLCASKVLFENNRVRTLNESALVPDRGSESVPEVISDEEADADEVRSEMNARNAPSHDATLEL